MWIIAGVTLSFGGFAAPTIGLSVVFSGASTTLVWISVCCAVLTIMRPTIIRSQPLMVADILIASCLFALIGMAGGLWSYVVAYHSRGYVDDWFVAFDRSMGFDWLGWYNFERSVDELKTWGRVVYTMFWVMPLPVITALILGDKRERLTRLLVAHYLGVCLTVGLFAVFPMRSAVVQLVGTMPPYMPFTGIEQVEIIDGLRAGTLTLIDLGELSGIIGFPSYHAAGSILFIWACWPLKFLRWPMLGINLAVIAATPVEGAHYLADVIGGAIVAAVAIMVAGRWRLPAFASRRPAYAMAVET